MRRSEKQITDIRELEDILVSGDVCRVGLAVDNTPYVVPVNFAYFDGHIYFHSAPEGRKIEMIVANPRVFFEVSVDCQVEESDKACGWAAVFSSVMGTGTAILARDSETKKSALDLIMKKYSGREGWEYSRHCPRSSPHRSN